MAARMTMIVLFGFLMMCVVQSSDLQIMHKSRMSAYDHEITNKYASQEGAGKASFVWKTFLNKHIDPVCSNSEYKHNFGVMNSLDECMKAVVDSKLGNVGIWQRGLDQNCYVCDLHARGKAPSLSFIDSHHIDAFVSFVGEHQFYSNDGTEFMKTPGQWLVSCFDLPNNTKYITTKYLNRVDYFKPLNNEDFCTMLVSNQHHLWSPDASDDSWKEPDFTDGDHETCGGGSSQANSDNEDIGTWCTLRNGQADPTGGSINGVWGKKPFTMTYHTEYVACSPNDGSGLSTVGYPCECGNTQCSAGEACDSGSSQCGPPLLPQANSTANTTAAATTAAPTAAAHTAAPTAAAPTPAATTTTIDAATTTTIGAASTTVSKTTTTEKQSRACPAASLFSIFSALMVMWLPMP